MKERLQHHRGFKKWVGLFLWILCLMPLKSFSQTDSIKQSYVRIKSRAQQDKILLRWAVDRAIPWQKANTYGFELEKYVFSKNGNRLPQPQKLWSKTLKADPLETWQEIVEQDDYAAIIAQALYGDSFAVEGESQGELSAIVNLVEETQQRFSFALLAADMNFEVAQKAGWGYVDAEVKKGETYVYKIKTLVPKEKQNIQSSSALVSIDDFEELPAPIDLQGIFGDRNAILTWEYELFKDIYTSYFIERSMDGKSFNSLSDKPLVNLNDSPKNPAKRMYYIDSLAQNGTEYYYRVQGISSFGEKGTYSEIISGKGKDILTYTPRIIDFQFTENPNEAIIKWEFPKEGEKEVKEFQLIRADQDSGPYETVATGITPSKRQYQYDKLNPSNYFKIKAIGKSLHKERTSFSTLIQPIDSIAPLAPIELTGEIDSLGIARLSWKANEEKDLDGYKIYRAFNKKEEASPLLITPQQHNSYIDSLQLKNLNSKVYYKVVAVDKRFNHSEYSEMLVLEKPDVIPPTSPVFKAYKIENGKVILDWISSSDKEAKHYVLREDLDDGLPPKVVFQTDTIQSFTDEKVEANKKYRYFIKAIDNAGLESQPSTPLTLTVINLEPTEVIKEVNSYVDRQNNYVDIFWRADADQIAEYTIYKQTGEKPPTTWRVVSGQTTRLTDQEIKVGNTYIYHIRATLNNGKYAVIKKLEIHY